MARKKINNNNARMSIYLDKETKKIIEARAKATNISINKIVGEVLADYASKYKEFADKYYQLQDKINKMNADFAKDML